jgi:LysM repeat protein
VKQQTISGTNGTTVTSDYDTLGRLVHYNTGGADYNTYYDTSVASRKDSQTSTRGGLQSSVTNTYDANGYLIQVTPAGGGNTIENTNWKNGRTLVNDAQGRVLINNEATGHSITTLIANGQVVGSASDALSDVTSTFGQDYVPISDASLTAGPMAYTVQQGDTMQSIAKQMWGNSELWFAIADANGIDTVTAGEVIAIPQKPNTIYSQFDTSTPYDPSKAVGDTTPVAPIPQNDGGCGGLGQMIAMVVAVVVTIYTAGAASELLAAPTCTATGVGLSAGEAAVAGGAIGGAAGSIAGQAVNIAEGNQSAFNWSQVGLSAVAGGVSAGVQELAQGTALASNNFQATVGRAVIGNMASQGIGVATGLQKSFSWHSVAASAVGAGVGQQVGSAFNGTNTDPFVARLVTGLAAGGAAAIASGGRVAVQQVAADAFGNAIGSSLADQSSSGSGSMPVDNTQLPTGDFARADRSDYLLQQSIAQSDAIQNQRLYENSVDVAQENFRATEVAYRQATDTGAVIRPGDVLERLSGGSKEMMGRYIVGMGLSDPNMLQVGQSMQADWNISSGQAVGLSNAFYVADAQKRAALATATATGEGVSEWDDNTTLLPSLATRPTTAVAASSSGLWNRLGNVDLSNVPGVGWLSRDQAISSANDWQDRYYADGNPIYALAGGAAKLWADHAQEVGTLAMATRGMARPTPEYMSDGTRMPFGFTTEQEFLDFSATLRAGLPAGVEPVFQGSSVTGIKASSGGGIPAGTPFDVGRLSDLDIGLVSEDLATKAALIDGVRIKTGPTRIGPFDANSPAAAQLGLSDLAAKLSAQAGRPVTFMLHDSMEGAYAQPSLFVPKP